MPSRPTSACGDTAAAMCPTPRQRNDFLSWPGLSPQVGYTRLAAGIYSVRNSSKPELRRAIHVFDSACLENVDDRHKAGHDEAWQLISPRPPPSDSTANVRW